MNGLEEDEMTVEYVGWIGAKETDRGLLRALGVRGEMKYDEEANVFTHCDCGEVAMEALMLGFPTFWPGSFTACDEDDEQLPYEGQKYWHYPHVIPKNFDTAERIGKWLCPRCDALISIESRRCSNCLAYRCLFGGEGYA